MTKGEHKKIHVFKRGSPKRNPFFIHHLFLGKIIYSSNININNGISDIKAATALTLTQIPALLNSSKPKTSSFFPVSTNINISTLRVTYGERRIIVMGDSGKIIIPIQSAKKHIFMIIS